MASHLPLGKFACEFTLEVVRPPVLEREERDGVTYLVGRDYELAYRTTLHFEGGGVLPITAVLIGDLNRQVVIRDHSGRPTGISGCVQGRSRITDLGGNPIFEGTYYDARVTQALTGDDALTPVGPRVIEHLENGFGLGAYVGHAFFIEYPVGARRGRTPKGPRERIYRLEQFIELNGPDERLTY